VPNEELEKLKDLGERELAKYFGIPEEMVRLRQALFEANEK